MIAAGLTVSERVCIAITHATARGSELIDRLAAGGFTLTEQGRAVLEALMMRAATRG